MKGIQHSPVMVSVTSLWNAEEASQQTLAEESGGKVPPCPTNSSATESAPCSPPTLAGRLFACKQATQPRDKSGPSNGMLIRAGALRQRCIVRDRRCGGALKCGRDNPLAAVQAEPFIAVPDAIGSMNEQVSAIPACVVLREGGRKEHACLLCAGG